MARSIHFIGVGGIGMSGLAAILLELGYQSLSGSDIHPSESYTLGALQKRGLTVYEGHSVSHISPSVTDVVISSDISKDNVELQEARRRNLSILHRSDLLHEIMAPFRSLVVTGTHGKTTTSSLLSHVLTHFSKYENSFKSSFAVGGSIKNYATNAAYAQNSLYFAAEGDESDGTFLKYDPYAAIITNIDSDHLAHYGSMKLLEEAFQLFTAKVKNPQESLFVSGDCARIKEAIPYGIRYGFHSGNDIRIENLMESESGIHFDLMMKSGATYRSISLPLYGRHNAMNGAAVFALSLKLGISDNIIREAFNSFLGVARRLDKQYEGKNGIVVFDDYAHHPTEVKATLHAVKRAYPSRRICAIFQPHRPSRVKHIIGEFSKAFIDSDILFLTDLYSASEDSVENSALLERLKNTIQISHPGIEFRCLLEQDVLLSTLFSSLRPYDVVVFMGAGSIGRAAKDFSKLLEKNSVSKYSISVVYGGMNSENRISRMSAQAVWNNIDSNFFERKAFLIDLKGNWKRTDGISLHQDEKIDGASEKISNEIFQQLLETELLFPVLHGPYGEDGTIQGFCEILGIPYVGSDHVGSALAMDKSLSKMIAEAIKVPVTPFVTLRKSQWQNDSKKALQAVIEHELAFPLFIKPVHLGSSIGVQKIEKLEELPDVLEELFEIDDKLIIEEGLTSFREIEFTPMGNGSPNIPAPGEIVGHDQVYDYKAKYGAHSFETHVQADLDPILMEEGRDYARKMYEALGFSGLCRIDFFLKEGGLWYFNEANPIPGFTDISLYPSVWKRNGMGFSEIISSLALLGLQKHRQKRVVTCGAIYKGRELESLCAL